MGVTALTGWVVGSTIGSLIDLRDAGSQRTQEGQKITDFKGFNSKYGIAIPRGYGTVRLGGNMIWNSDVTEIENLDTTCQSQKVFFFFSIENCLTVQTFRYFQSAAIGLAEGPACNIRRIWADGKLVHDSRPVLPGPDNDFAERATPTTISQASFITACNPDDAGPFRKYLGFPNQQIDWEILEALSPDNSPSGLDEAYAFRNLVYLMVSGLELEPFGYRLPSFTAEVHFQNCTDYYTTYLPESTVQVKNNWGTAFVGYPWSNKVHGHPELLWAQNSGTRVLWNVRTHEIVFQDEGDIGGQIRYGRRELSPHFWGMSGQFYNANDFVVYPQNFFTLRIGKGQTFVGAAASLRVGRMGGSRWDHKRHGFWWGAGLGSTFGFMPLTVASFPAPNEVVDGIDTISTGFEVSVPVTGQLVQDFEGGTYPISAWQQETSNWRVEGIELDKDCNAWFYLNHPGNSNSKLYKIAEAAEGALQKVTPTGIQIRNSVGSPVYMNNCAYDPYSDSFVFFNGFNMYRVTREDIDAVIDASGTFIDLPANGTVGFHIGGLSNGTQDDPGWWHNIQSGYISMGGADGLGRHNWVHIGTMTVGPPEFEHLHAGTNVGASQPTVHFPHLSATHVGSFGMKQWRGDSPGVPLSDIVTDLLVKTDGDNRARLTTADIDVTELTDTVKGFVLNSQITGRGAIEILQQAYFFDAVESDGKIKFPKRGRAATFAVNEDDLAAHSFDSIKDDRVEPITYVRQSQAELPRELAINYADKDYDFLQSTQRARKVYGFDESNTSINLPVVLDKDEAAQIADILLSEAHITRTSEFTFRMGPSELRIDPADVGTVTMRDGTVHNVRVMQTNIGANGIIEAYAALENADIYSSTATGESDLVVGEPITNDNMVALIFDVTTRPLYNEAGLNQFVIVGGIGSYGRFCGTGCHYTWLDYPSQQPSLNSCVGPYEEESCVTWGYVSNEVGHPDPYIASNVPDPDTTITLSILGGATPTTKTLAEALGGLALIVIGDEIIGYTDVEAPFEEGVTGNDISGIAGNNGIINSVTTDFVAAGLQAGDAIELQKELAQTNYPMPWMVKAYVIDSVTTNQIILRDPVPDNGQRLNFSWSAGEGVIINRDGRRRIILTNCLRGLFGTERNQHHKFNTPWMVLDSRAFLAQSPPWQGQDGIIHPQSPFIKSGTAFDNRDQRFNSMSFQTMVESNNLKPWAPGNVVNAGTAFTWQRRDKWYTDGIIPSPPPANEDFPSSEAEERYQWTVLDTAPTPGLEGTITAEGVTNVPEATIPIANSPPSIVIIKQMADVQNPKGDIVEHPGFEYWGHHSSTGTLTGGGNIADGSYTPTLRPRWNTGITSFVTAIGDGTWPTALGVMTRNVVDDAASGQDIVDAGLAMDTEILAIVVPDRSGANNAVTNGVFLRGGGPLEPASLQTNSNITGFVAGLGGNTGFSSNQSRVDHFISNGSKVNYTNLGALSLSWFGPGRHENAFAIRFRLYGNRASMKTWEVFDPGDPTSAPEPAAWQVVGYDGRVGPRFGAIGIWSLNKLVFERQYTTYFSWAHGGGTAP